jgi:Ca2+-binding EF-hand superfamily protein
VTRADANGTSKISYEEFLTVVKEHEKKPMVCALI